jgi:hypothetical protein
MKIIINRAGRMMHSENAIGKRHETELGCENESP